MRSFFASAISCHASLATHNKRLTHR